MATGHEHRANRFGVVVIGATPEGAQIHLHADAAPAPADAARLSRCVAVNGSVKWNALPLPSPAL
jgi:hypothetical protein